MIGKIPYGRQTISQEDVDAVVNVLRSEFLTQGPWLPTFEESISALVGANYSLAVNSATSALHLACVSLGLGPGDRLWTSPNSFVASANCARYCGASVDFVDIDPYTYNMCPVALRTKLEQAKISGVLPKIVVPVHFAGQSCDMESIGNLAQEFGFYVIEDASHAIGGYYKGGPIGNCLHSDITIFSFHPVKIITTGEGGIITTNSHAIARRVESLRSHCITREQSQMVNLSHGAWYYEQTDLGYNFRMNELQAALGVSQLKSLDDFICARREISDRYNEGLSDLDIILPWQHPDSHSSFHLYVIQIRDQAPLNRLELFDTLRRALILVNVHYIPIHLQPYYSALGFTKGDFPEAEKYYERAISLPIYPLLSEAEQAHVISCIRNAFLRPS